MSHANPKELLSLLRGKKSKDHPTLIVAAFCFILIVRTFTFADKALLVDLRPWFLTAS